MLKIVFFGTPKFSATILAFLLKQPIQILAVVTKPDKPRGRSGTPQPSAVKELALEHQLPVYQPFRASSPEFAEFLSTLQADLFVVVAYSEILKENLLKMPRLDCLNVHASLLPKYRGAAPIQWSIMEGEKESGVTIMSMAKELDAGDMLAVAKAPIHEEMTAGELSDILAQIGAEALWKVLQAYESGNVKRYQQDPSQVTYAKKLTSADGRIDWEESAQAIHNRVRGLNPKPGAWCFIRVKGEEKRLLIKKARVESVVNSEHPGTILQEKGLVIACGSGTLRLLEVQLEGKKALSAEEFLRGFSSESKEFDLKF